MYFIKGQRLDQLKLFSIVKWLCPFLLQRINGYFPLKRSQRILEHCVLHKREVEPVNKDDYNIFNKTTNFKLTFGLFTG